MCGGSFSTVSEHSATCSFQLIDPPKIFKMALPPHEQTDTPINETDPTKKKRRKKDFSSRKGCRIREGKRGNCFILQEGVSGQKIAPTMQSILEDNILWSSDDIEVREDGFLWVKKKGDTGDIHGDGNGENKDAGDGDGDRFVV